MYFIPRFIPPPSFFDRNLRVQKRKNNPLVQLSLTLKQAILFLFLILLLWSWVLYFVEAHISQENIQYSIYQVTCSNESKFNFKINIVSIFFLLNFPMPWQSFSFSVSHTWERQWWWWVLLGQVLSYEKRTFTWTQIISSSFPWL